MSSLSHLHGGRHAVPRHFALPSVDDVRAHRSGSMLLPQLLLLLLRIRALSFLARFLASASA
jgi:hypothetical protein